MADPGLAARLDELADDPAAVAAAHREIQAVLVELRDSRFSLLGRGNGLVIRERDGTDSASIRMSTPEAVRVALRAIAGHLRGGGTGV